MQPLNNHYIPIHRPTQTSMRWSYSDMDGYDVRPVPVNFGHIHYSPLHESNKSPFAQVTHSDKSLLASAFQSLRAFFHPLSHMLPGVQGPHFKYCTLHSTNPSEIHYMALA